MTKKYGETVAIRLSTKQLVELDQLFDQRIPRSTLIREAVDLLIEKKKKEESNG
jgi:metal-responsive CopG/Arc/MetJ family transcriptional regulator